ncbi:MAG: radical SAM protein [Methanocellales archaeon]|nr:radical SAM protein [Methanocellales archaeon]
MAQSRCQICGERELVSSALGACADCIRDKTKRALPFIREAHIRSRIQFGLPLEPPKHGVRCGLCVNECRISPGERGYCGLRTNKDGKLVHLGGTSEKGIVQCYYDPLPTNCVAANVCPGGTGAGYPRFSHSKSGPEYGYHNLAVFYGACSFDCLFCQNWHYREMASHLTPTMSARELASQVDEKTSCICFFGGDPTPQLPHAIETSEVALKDAEDILRICWESNGTMSLPLLKRIAKLSLDTGGNIKFDLKVWDEDLHKALCSVTNARTLENFRWLAEYGKQRPDPPFLTASTLLIPGYVDVKEVTNIAKFIADLNPGIPYSLLAFYPQFYMDDLPTTSRKHAERCIEAARKAGLQNIRLGNVHLLR